MNKQVMINKANELLESGTYTRMSLARAVGVASDTLRRYSDEIPKYPRPMSRKQSAVLGVKTGAIKWGSKFKLRGSPNFKENGNG